MAGLGYGVVLEPGVYSIGQHMISISDEGGGSRRYLRSSPGGGFSAIISRGLNLVLVPMYPVFRPSFVTRFVLVELETPVLLAPQEAVEVYIVMEADLGVYAVGGDGSWSLFDVVQISERPSLVLYGPPDSGVVARRMRSWVYRSEPEPGIGKVVALASLENSSREPVTVSRILVDCAPLKLYYRRGSWEAYTQELNLQAERFRGTVLYRQPFKEGLVELEDPPEVRPPRFFQKTDMQWGV